MEISDIQLLGVLLIIIIFFFMFQVIEANWALKAEQYAADEEEAEAMPIVAQIGEDELPARVFPAGKEIRLVPLKPLKKNPAAAFSVQLPGEISFSAVREEEEVLELLKAR
ncbi:MAG: hypothetical protein JWO44_1402 [Bacteroidetes bacterium]|jgi:hypothetical protein|nr:hypothetical protein [Bacteroidota bacterium]